MTTLPFEHLDGLVGREKEAQSLHDAYERVLASPHSCEAVLIHGESGTGKTALVRHNFQRQHDNGTLISGKFDIIRNQMPYSAIVDALTQLCLSSVWKNMTNEEEFQSNLRVRLGKGDLAILSKLVPAVKQRVFNEDKADDGDSSQVSIDNAFAFARFAEIVRCFLYMVARFLPTPLVLFLDDVQAADPESLSLISALTARHAESCNLLLVLAYRSHVVDVEQQQPKENNFLSRTTDFFVTDLEVGTLHEDDVNKLISKLLRMDAEETMPLSRLVTKRTGGNIFFVLQALEALTSETLLGYSFESCRWVWNLEKIRTDINVTDNMAHLLTAKIRQLSPDVQSVLQLAACIGFYFDVGFLDRMFMHKKWASSLSTSIENLPILPERNSTDIDKEGHGVLSKGGKSDDDQFRCLIAVAVEENLIDQATGTRYKFTHDRVLQAAYDMIPAGTTRNMLHWQIGQVLWNDLQQAHPLQKNPSQATDDWLKFAAADQLNRGSDWGLMRKGDGVTLLDLALLNLEAGKAALEKSAFKHAAGFFDHGVQLVHKRWQSDYSLCLELHTLSTEAEYTICNFDKCDKLTNEIMANGRCIEDKMPAYFIKVQSKGVQGNLLEAMDESVVALRLLGERLPRRPSPLRVLLELSKTKRLMQKRKIAVADFVALPDMTDSIKIWAIKFLQNLEMFSWYAGKSASLAVSALRMVQLTIQYGISAQAPFVVSTYGFINGFLGDFSTAYEAGQVSLELTKRPHTISCHARTVAAVFAFLDHLRRPLIRILDHCITSYYSGMKNGEIEGAATALTVYAALGIYLGKNLNIVLSEMEGFHQAYRDEVECNFVILCIFPYHQFTLNLMGRNQNPLILTGEIMDEDAFLKEAQRTGNAISEVTITILRMILHYIFCDMKAASHMVAKLRMEVVSKGTHFATPFLIMYAALVMLAMARETRKRKFSRRAKVFKRILQHFVNGGDINIPPMLELVSAEQTSLRRRCPMADVKKAYESAIRMASQSGLSVVEAVGNERAGEYMLSVGDTFWAETFLSRAVFLYDEWGATAKTNQLNGKYTFLASSSSLRMPHRRNVSVALRRRYNYKESNERQRLSVST